MPHHLRLFVDDDLIKWLSSRLNKSNADQDDYFVDAIKETKKIRWSSRKGIVHEDDDEEKEEKEEEEDGDLGKSGANDEIEDRDVYDV